MVRPTPTIVMHFTHVNHLGTVVQNGLIADSRILATGLVTDEVGSPGIKERRRGLTVDCGPEGMVGDYVPWYYAPRSPMMYTINRGGVATGELVYLVTTVEALTAEGVKLVFSDRNAAKAVATFFDDPELLDDMVDWELMRAKWWNDTEAEPDRMERRQAECLAYERVPWSAILHVVVSAQGFGPMVEKALNGVAHQPTVSVRPDWYY